MLFKTLPLSVKEIDEKQFIVEGYASAFGSIDSDGDIIRKGAFSKTINEWGPNGKNRIMHLAQHNPSHILGKPIMLMEDDYGLKFRSKISDTNLGRDYLQLYLDGVINEHSIGFNTIMSDMEDGANVIKEVKLWEYSSVTWGANENTPTLSAKSATAHLDTLYKAYYNGKYTDETFDLIQSQIINIKEFISSLDRNDASTPQEPQHVEEEPIAKSINSFIQQIQQWK